MTLAPVFDAAGAAVAAAMNDAAVVAAAMHDAAVVAAVAMHDAAGFGKKNKEHSKSTRIPERLLRRKL